MRSDQLSRDSLEQVKETLSMAPSLTGGHALVVATGGRPPALALLSTSEVLLANGRLLVAVHAGSSVSRRLGGCLSLLVPTGSTATRVLIDRAVWRMAGPLDVVEGQLSELRPTAEPPWSLQLRFTAADPQPQFLDYWAELRTWLADGASGHGPAPPHVRSGPASDER